MKENPKPIQFAHNDPYFDPGISITYYDMRIDYCTFWIARATRDHTLWQDRGMNKLKKAVKTKNTVLFDEGVKDIKRAILLVNIGPIKGYPRGEGNLKWAEELKVEHCL